MRYLRQKIHLGLEVNQAKGQISPHHQEKKISKSAMAQCAGECSPRSLQVVRGQAGFVLRQVHQNIGQIKVARLRAVV